MMSCPHPKAEERIKTRRPNLHPSKGGGRREGTGVAALPQESGRCSPTLAPAREGPSLPDKGMGEKVRDPTPEGEVQQAGGGAGPSTPPGERLGF